MVCIKTKDSVYTDAYTFLFTVFIELQAEMLKYNALGSFDLVNLFIKQQEYEMQRKL